MREIKLFKAKYDKRNHKVYHYACPLQAIWFPERCKVMITEPNKCIHLTEGELDRHIVTCAWNGTPNSIHHDQGSLSVVNMGQSMLTCVNVILSMANIKWRRILYFIWFQFIWFYPPRTVIWRWLVIIWVVVSSPPYSSAVGLSGQRVLHPWLSWIGLAPLEVSSRMRGEQAPPVFIFWAGNRKELQANVEAPYLRRIYPQRSRSSPY